MKQIKKRHWAFVLYEESAPLDWKEQLQLTGLSVAISPIHDNDINADNTIKKAHYHIILCYDGPTTYNCVKTLTDNLKQPIPQPLEQVRGYYRYLVHKDNPEKAQYDENLIICLNGFNVADFISTSEVNIIKIDIQKIIRDNEIHEYCQLMDFLLDGQMMSYWTIASTNTMFFDRYITSFKYKTREEKTVSKLKRR